jgi:hypothetical protein
MLAAGQSRFRGILAFRCYRPTAQTLHSIAVTEQD